MLERQGGIGCELVLALDAPVLQMVEEMGDVLLAPLALQEQAIVPEIPQVPRHSSVVRAVQPMDFEQFFDVPVLHMDYEDYMFSRFVEQMNIMNFLKFKLIESSSVLANKLWTFPFFLNQYSNAMLSKLSPYLEQVVAVPDPLASVSGRNLEQVMDVSVQQRAHVLPATSSERIVEQVTDVPGPRGAPGLAHAQQLTSRAAAAWLNAPQGHSEGFLFALFRDQEKCEGYRAVECGTGVALQPVHVISLWSEHLH